MDGVPRGGMFQAMNSLKGSPVLGQLKSPVEKFLYHTQKECNCFWALILELQMKADVAGEWNLRASCVGKLTPLGFLPACFPVTNVGGGGGGAHS